MHALADQPRLGFEVRARRRCPREYEFGYTWVAVFSKETRDAVAERDRGHHDVDAYP
jgi:hypothetical protein